MVDYPENFKDYPESVQAIKAGKERHMHIWTPRDALIDALRHLDSLPEGEKIDALVCCFRLRNKEGTTFTQFTQAGPDAHTTIGLLEVAKTRILEDE